MVGVPAATRDVVGIEKRPIWHKSNRRPLFYCSVFVLGAFLYGYDGTYFTGILAMNTFRRQFGQYSPNNDQSIAGGYRISTSDESLYASIVQAGELVGSLSAAFIGDAFGRKGALRAALLTVTVGAVLQLILVGSKPLLTVGRLVLGAGVGIISNCVPLYLSEIPPASLRGSVVSCWQLLLAIGQVIGAVIAQGTKDYESTFSWRFPIAFNMLIVLTILLGSFFVPESPRWLLQKRKDDKALWALEAIHKKNDDHDAETELSVLIESRRVEDTGGEGSKWSDLMAGPNLRRLYCVFGILCCQQISGVQFIFSYATVFFESIGQTNAFEMTIIVDILEVLGVIVSLFLVNRFGRRPLLLYTMIFMTLTLVVVGALGIDRDRSKAMNTAIASMIMLYVFAFNLAWGPLAWACATELAAGKHKNKLMGVGTAGFWICAWAVTFTLPYLYNADQANLGPLVGWIYAGGGLISLAFVYFCIPETLGRSLEEIQVMMDLGVPTRAWRTYRVDNVNDEFGNDEFRSSAKRRKGMRGQSEHVENDSKDRNSPLAV